MAPPAPVAQRLVPSRGSTAISTESAPGWSLLAPTFSPMKSMGASSRSPSPMTMVPSMAMVSRHWRMDSTAAWSAVLGSPMPMVRAEAMALSYTTRRTSREGSNMVACYDGSGWQVWRMAPRVRWIHSRSAGLDELLFPELAESAVPLTNARGVFSEILGEFAIAAVLFFAKGLRRMVRSQEAGVWDQFDTVQVAGQTMGVI